MELTDLERQGQEYAARCFENRYLLMQQLATSFAEKFVAAAPGSSNIADAAIELAAYLLDGLDKYTDENGERLREYYRNRHRRIDAAWDKSKFSSEAWLKREMGPEHDPGTQS